MLDNAHPVAVRGPALSCMQFVVVGVAEGAARCRGRCSLLFKDDVVNLPPWCLTVPRSVSHRAAPFLSLAPGRG
jgi:hypothetical protein